LVTSKKIGISGYVSKRTNEKDIGYLLCELLAQESVAQPTPAAGASVEILRRSGSE